MADILGPAAGIAGVFGLIAFLVGIIVRAMVLDRTDYRERIALEKANVKAERDRAELAQMQVDEEMSRRRESEGRAAAAEAELGAQRALLAFYAAEIDRLRRASPDAPGPAPGG